MLLDDNKSKFISFKIFLIDQSPYAMTLQIKKNLSSHFSIVTIMMTINSIFNNGKSFLINPQDVTRTQKNANGIAFYSINKKNPSRVLTAPKGETSSINYRRKEI